MPGGDDPNFPTPTQTAAMNIKDPYIQGQGPALVAPEAQEEAAAAPPVRENTSPTFPVRAGEGPAVWTASKRRAPPTTSKAKRCRHSMQRTEGRRDI
jgi:hypothetical protein